MRVVKYIFPKRLTSVSPIAEYGNAVNALIIIVAIDLAKWELGRDINTSHSWIYFRLKNIAIPININKLATILEQFQCN